MNLFELFDRSIPGYQSIEDDGSQLQKYDNRKARLTLKQINKIRLMNDIRNYEYDKKLKLIQKQYNKSPEAEGGPGGESLI